MNILCGGDQLEHMGANQQISKFLEIAMIVVLNFSNTPAVFAASYLSTISSLNSLGRTNDGIGGRTCNAFVAHSRFLIFAIDSTRKYGDVVIADGFTDLIICR